MCRSLPYPVSASLSLLPQSGSGVYRAAYPHKNTIVTNIWIIDLWKGAFPPLPSPDLNCFTFPKVQIKICRIVNGCHCSLRDNLETFGYSMVIMIRPSLVISNFATSLFFIFFPFVTFCTLLCRKHTSFPAKFRN